MDITMDPFIKENPLPSVAVPSLSLLRALQPVRVQSPVMVQSPARGQPAIVPAQVAVEHKSNPTSGDRQAPGFDRQGNSVSERRANPVYQFYKTKAHEIRQEIRAEWDAGGESRTNLADRNKGVRCYMKRQDIFDQEALREAINEFSVPTVTTAVKVSDLSGVETLLSMGHELDPDPDQTFVNLDTVMLALYAPQPSPCATIFGGIPHEVTDLALRSTLIWQLKSPALRLSDTEKLCELFATTAFYLPNMEVRREGFEEGYVKWMIPESINVTLMSDVESVLSHWEQAGRQDVKMSNLIYLKLATPLFMALRQNQNRKKLGLAPIRKVVFGDLALRSSEKGVNSLLAQRLTTLVQQFNGCFDEIIVCSPVVSTRMHVHQHCNSSDSTM